MPRASVLSPLFPLATRVVKLALRQGGTIGTKQLHDLGADSGRVARFVREGWLIRVHQSAYRLAGHPPNDHGRAHAALLAYGPRAVLSGRSAAFAHGLITDLGPRVHVTLASHRRDRQGVQAHKGSLSNADLTRVNGLAATRVPRMLLDIAGREHPSLLTLVLRKAGEHGRLDIAAVEAVIARSAGHRGVTELREALRRRDPNRGHTRSSLEIAVSDFLIEYGFPPADRNVLVSIGGEELTLVDFVWPWAFCCLEADHRAYHDGHERFDEDRRISRRLMAAGWSTPRATGIDIDEPARRHELATDLWAILERAAARLAPSGAPHALNGARGYPALRQPPPAGVIRPRSRPQ